MSIQINPGVYVYLFNAQNVYVNMCVCSKSANTSPKACAFITLQERFVWSATGIRQQV